MGARVRFGDAIDHIEFSTYYNSIKKLYGTKKMKLIKYIRKKRYVQ